MNCWAGVDGGRSIDWDRTSEDYARYRPGPPESFYSILGALGAGLPGQQVLDLGTGTGVLARRFAQQACTVTGVDIAAGQIDTARSLAGQQGLEIDFRVAPAEQTGFPDHRFHIISASQCWLYFDKSRVIPEVKRLLAAGGRLLVAHLNWLPKLDRIAAESEQLVVKFNPNWDAGGYGGDVPVCPEWARGHFRVAAMFFYDEAIPFSKETWRGRFRACRGVGASLPPEQVSEFDLQHARLLDHLMPDKDEFTVLHRLDAHLYQPL